MLAWKLPSISPKSKKKSIEAYAKESQKNKLAKIVTFNNNDNIVLSVFL